MERIELEDQALENVTGGSIIFSPDHKSCGLNCKNQCTVNNYDAAMAYIMENKDKMTEKQLMRGMLSAGYITLNQ